MAVGDRYRRKIRGKDYFFEVVFEDPWGKLLELIPMNGMEVRFLKYYWTNLEIKGYFTPLTEKV